jgi:hypothetical protein
VDCRYLPHTLDVEPQTPGRKNLPRGSLLYNNTSQHKTLCQGSSYFQYYLRYDTHCVLALSTHCGVGHGTTRIDPRRRECPRHDRHRVLVRAVGTPDMAKLSDQEHRRSSSRDDADLVDFGSPVRRLRSGATIQHSPHHSATVLLRTVPGQLGAVSYLWTVSETAHSYISF